MAERTYGPRREPPPGFGAALKEQRLALGLSQSVLATRSGIGVDYYRQLEYGKRYPSAATLDKLAEALRQSSSGMVPLRVRKFKRHRRWRPECPTCHSKDMVVKLRAGMFCQRPSCFRFLPPEVMKRPSSAAVQRFPMMGAGLTAPN